MATTKPRHAPHLGRRGVSNSYPDQERSAFAAYSSAKACAYILPVRFASKRIESRPWFCAYRLNESVLHDYTNKRLRAEARFIALVRPLAVGGVWPLFFPPVGLVQLEEGPIWRV